MVSLVGPLSGDSELLQCLCGRTVNAAALSACPRCGMTTERIRSVTPEERAAQQAAFLKEAEDLERARKAAEVARQEEADRLQQEYVDEALQRMRQAVAEGRTPSLMVVEYIRSHYTVDTQEGGAVPDARSLFEYGLDGWEVVSTFPHTTGKVLTNSSAGSTSYGGGLGGLVDGVYVLLRLPVTAALLETRPHVVADAIVRVYESRGRNTPAEKQMTLGTGSLPQPTVSSQPSRSGRTTWFGYGISVPMGDGFDVDW